MKKYDLLYITFVVVLNFSTSDTTAQKTVWQEDSCICLQDLEKFHGRYMPPATLYFDHNTFKDYVNWKLADSSLLDSIYVQDLVANVDRYESIYHFHAVSYKPIRFWHPDSTFLVNLNPCKNNRNHYSIPVSLAISYGASSQISGFDYREFDETATAYFEVVESLYGISEFSILTNSLERLSYTEDDELTELNNYLQLLAERYNIDIPKMKPKYGSFTSAIDSVVNRLSRANVDLMQLILNDFVLTDSSYHKINEVEKRRLEILFAPKLGPNSIDDLRYSIYPSTRLSVFDTIILGIEISKDILRNDNNEQVTILANLPEFSYSTSQGLDVRPNYACLPESFISGTGITICSDTINLISTDLQKQHLSYHSNKPLYSTSDTVWKKVKQARDNETVGKAENLLDNFTGLVVPRAKLKIPYKRRMIETGEAMLIINNRFVLGEARIMLAPKQPKNPGKVKIVSGTSTYNISLQKLQEENEIMTNPQIVKDSNTEDNHTGKYLHFYFLKVAGQ